MVVSFFNQLFQLNNQQISCLPYTGYENITDIEICPFSYLF